MKHPGKVGGGCLGRGSIPTTWSLVPQEKESSSRDMEVAQGTSDLRSTRCATPGYVRSLPVVTPAAATMSNEVPVAGSSNGGLENNRQLGGCWGAEEREI